MRYTIFWLGKDVIVYASGERRSRIYFCAVEGCLLVLIARAIIKNSTEVGLVFQEVMQLIKDGAISSQICQDKDTSRTGIYLNK